MFYGWYIVAAALLIMTYSLGTVTYGFTAFIAPIAATFGWSYAQISLALSLRGIEVGALDPLIGMAADRWPSRRLMLIGVTLYGLGIICISQATNLAMFYTGFLIIGLGGSTAIAMVPRTTIARWFKRDVGKASGILTISGGVSGALLPVLVILIDTYGWQTSLLIVAAGMWMLGIPLSFVFRTRPEEYGLLPDGKLQDDVKDSSISESHDFGTGVREALKMRAFWHIGFAYMFQVSAIMAVMTHVMPYLASVGVERSTASLVTMLILLVSLPARVGFGWLADIITSKYVSAMTGVLTSVGLFLFWLINGSSLGLMIGFVVIFGFGHGGMVPVRLVLVRRYFGTKRIGTILGLTGVFTMTGIVISPPVAGWVYDTLGYYDPIWLILSGVALIGAILMASTPSASRKLEPIT